MYCANCGTQLVQGLSYCNRCGFDVRTRTQSSTGSIAAFLTAITLLGVIGLGLMFGGALSQTNHAEQSDGRSEEHTSELQSHLNLVCRLLLEKKKTHRAASLPP